MIVNKFNTVVVLGTYNRGHLLQRSLQLYAKQDPMMLVVIDDGSTDDTEDICRYHSTLIHYIKLTDKEPGEWRDSASFLNLGIRYALHQLEAKHIFITHPEVIPGLWTIRYAVECAKDNNTWVSCKPWYLGHEEQAVLDNYDWKNNPHLITTIPGFYGKSELTGYFGFKDYLPENIEKIDTWHSWLFGGGSREFWLRFGGLNPTKTWGSVDMDLMNRRNAGNINTVTPNYKLSMVVHQNHDDLGTPKDMNAAMRNVPCYDNTNCFKPELLAP